MDLLIVADPDDSLAVSFSEFVKSSGINVARLSLIEASKIFTIEINRCGTNVYPEVPQFIRIPSLPIQRKSFDSEFYYGECFATLWATAAFTKSPVVNRPSTQGLFGNWTSSALITENQLNINTGRFEAFSRKPQASFENYGLWIQDLSTWLVEESPNIPNGTGPYRYRPAIHSGGYEFVTVVGDSAWRATSKNLEGISLEAESIAIIKKLNLTFGVVIWSISSSLDEVFLVKVEPFPQMSLVQFNWSDVQKSLLKILLT
ncbi:hypothetical protein [Leptothoe spongobia]|uniref:Uncharacterized protein n=1 Tax=Leptothoe spongobia TAU-MAC 1115 TaxID=1967444 RepID=A0A947GMK5_9CYAN|nr:hypothetical protein [Leptothoe spongobia]MBT9317727.1 hypothetical protein [Leptothoe spongobia TAU-MAC 1115]